MSGCLNKLIPKLILIIVALLLVAAVGGAITEDGNQDAFDTAMEELPFAGPISKVLCNIMKLDKGEELLSANDLITDVLKVLIMSCIHPAIARILSRIFLKLPAGSVYDQEAYMETMSYRIKELVNDILIAAIPFCLLYYSSSPRKISLRSTSSASSFPSALACSSGYFDPVRSISITDA